MERQRNYNQSKQMCIHQRENEISSVDIGMLEAKLTVIDTFLKPTSKKIIETILRHDEFSTHS